MRFNKNILLTLAKRSGYVILVQLSDRERWTVGTPVSTFQLQVPKSRAGSAGAATEDPRVKSEEDPNSFPLTPKR